jgi:hypothetical protein
LGIFTKIFVVLVMILSVLLVGLIVAFVVNVETYRAKWVTAQAEAQVARLNYSLREADNLAAVQAASAEKEQLQTQIAALQSEITQNNQVILAQQGRIVELEAINADVRTELARLAAAEQKHAEINDTIQKEIRELREKNLTLATQNVELSQALNEKTTEANTLNRQVRFLSETIKDLERQNEQLAQGAGARTGVRTSAETTPGSKLQRGIRPDHPIRGIVTDVTRIKDDLFITINVGSNDGVREGMEFMIHQGDTYLGNAIIYITDLNSAAGRVTLQEGNIRPNEAQVLAGGEP